MRLTIRNTVMVGSLALVLTACEPPPVETEQVGYRGTGMVTVSNPRNALKPAEAPEALPPTPAGGPLARDAFQNVQVLGHLSVGEFTRTMTAMTAWVAPEEGCNYCHVPTDLADDNIYTKVVSRRMLQMTQAINDEWSGHVGDTGVTCLTCHGGQPVPEHIWFEDASEAHASAFAGNRAGQNIASESVGYTSLPSEPFSALLTQTDMGNIRIQPATDTPGQGGATIQATEATYGLMMHISDSLGVNCTYCHNTNSFGDWGGSTPQRVTAYAGIQMVRDINQNYLVPLQPEFPAHRLGAAGDAPKAYCATCHAGQPKPLGGAKLAESYPALKPE